MEQDKLNDNRSLYPWFYVKSFFDVMLKDWTILINRRPNAWKFDKVDEEEVDKIRFNPNYERWLYDEKRPQEYKDIRNSQTN